MRIVLGVLSLLVALTFGSGCGGGGGGERPGLGGDGSAGEGDLTLEEMIPSLMPQGQDVAVSNPTVGTINARFITGEYALRDFVLEAKRYNAINDAQEVLNVLERHDARRLWWAAYVRDGCCVNEESVVVLFDADNDARAFAVEVASVANYGAIDLIGRVVVLHTSMAPDMDGIADLQPGATRQRMPD